MKNINKKKAFTLAETLITLTILGVVAAITIPSLIQKYLEATNRTKVKKAMAAYEKVIRQLIVENNITGSIKSVFAKGQCDETSKYFKAIQIITGNKCRFQTSDKVWWDIYDIERPVISIKDELTDEMVNDIRLHPENYMGDENMFLMTGDIDGNGILRINDKEDTELTDYEKDYLDALFAYIQDAINPQRTCSDSTKNNNGSFISCTVKKYNGTQVYDSEGKIISGTLYCDEDYQSAPCHKLKVKYDAEGNYKYTIIAQEDNDVLYGTADAGISPGWMLPSDNISSQYAYMADCTSTECNKCFGDIEACKAIGYTKCNESSVYLGNSEHKGSDWGIYLGGANSYNEPTYTGMICTEE